MIADTLSPDNATASPARQLFRAAVAELAQRAQTAFPTANGRIPAAVQLVLAGDVTLLPDGSAQVGSQSDAETAYRVNGSCPCPDAQYRAEQGRCKHRYAVAIHRKATDLVAQRLDQPATPPPLPPVPDAPALPEAPASVNCYVTIGGRQVQVTLRDTDETRLLTRLETLLQRFPVAPTPATPATQTPPAEGWCAVHGVQMVQQHNEKGTWWSHNLNGTWCKGK